MRKTILCSFTIKHSVVKTLSARKKNDTFPLSRLTVQTHSYYLNYQNVIGTILLNLIYKHLLFKNSSRYRLFSWSFL